MSEGRRTSTRPIGASSRDLLSPATRTSTLPRGLSIVSSARSPLSHAPSMAGGRPSAPSAAQEALSSEKTRDNQLKDLVTNWMSIGSDDFLPVVRAAFDWVSHKRAMIKTKGERVSGNREENLSECPRIIVKHVGDFFFRHRFYFRPL